MERANGTVQAQLRAYYVDVQERMKVRVIHGTVVSMDVAAFIVDGGALPVRSENETEPVRENKRLSVRVSTGTIWRGGHGEYCRCRQKESQASWTMLGSKRFGKAV